MEQLLSAEDEDLLDGWQRAVVLGLSANGAVSGSTGCNEIFGSYSQSGPAGASLEFPEADLGSTTAGCAGEPPLIRRLLAVHAVEGEAGGLELLDESGELVARLVRRGENTDGMAPLD
ncbi:META domain-containing protein [Nocardioides sp. zg-578]|nr:META domain-containing protein [Nocardioides marmotae]